MITGEEAPDSGEITIGPLSIWLMSTNRDELSDDSTVYEEITDVVGHSSGWES